MSAAAKPAAEGKASSLERLGDARQASDEAALARRLAQHVLDRPRGDPDDDLAVLARQLLRREEQLRSVRESWGAAESQVTKWKFVASALLVAAKRHLATYPVFRSKPVGAPHSPARLEQQDCIATEDALRAAITTAEAAS